MPASETATWTVSRTDDAVLIQVTPRVPLREVAPVVLSQPLPVLVIAGVTSAYFLYEAIRWTSIASRPMPFGLAAIMFVIVGASFASWWFFFPPPFVSEHRRANSAQMVRITATGIETSAGHYDRSSIESLCLEHEGGLTGRQLLVFDGRAVKGSPVVGWPGVSEADATAIAELLRKYAAVGE